MIRRVLTPFTCLWANRVLAQNLVKRDISGRYKGSFLGVFWSFVNPLFLLALYTFVFKFVFKAKWPDVGDTTADFSIMLFAGLIVHSMAAEVLGRSCSLIMENPNFVKKVIFPLEILPWTTVISAVFHTSIGFLVLLCFLLFSGGSLSLTVLLVPFVLLPYALFLLGCSWFLAGLGVYLRDVQQLMGSFITLLLFTSTAFFSFEHAPEVIRPFLYLNPLSQIIEGMRDVVIYGRLPDLVAMAVYYLFSLIFMCFGFIWFQKTRKGFADVM